MIKANQYRTVTCGELREENIGQEVRVAGWVENIRDHGGVSLLIEMICTVSSRLF